MVKKIYLILLPILLLGCSQEESIESTAVKTFDTFTAFTEENPASKAFLNNDGTVKWDEDDCIGVFSDQQAPVKFKRCSDNLFRTENGQTVSGTRFYAYYPWRGYKYDAENPLQLKLTGDCQASTTAQKVNMPMVAVSSDNKLLFKQTTGMIHFRINGGDFKVGRVSLWANAWESLSGEGVIDLSASSPVLTFPDSERHSSKIIAYSDSEESEIKDCYFFLPPGKLSSGFFVSMTNKYDENYDVVKMTDKEVTIERGVMISYPEISIDAIFDELEQERDALIEFYNALDGPNWIRQKNWCSDKPVKEWEGIDVDHRTGRVVSIFLGNNKLKGNIPDVIGTFTELQYLDLKAAYPDVSVHNIITGTLPDSMASLKKLQYLNLHYNLLSGPFPEFIRGMDKLTAIDLDAAIDWKTGKALRPESFYGPIPDWIGELTFLETFSISQCGFEGELPASFSNLENLDYLSIDSNRFTGPLPDISKMQRLRWAYLGGNYFTGGIPSCYAQLFDNQVFDMMSVSPFVGNCLSGEIAPEILVHPSFPCNAWRFLMNQREGYKLSFDETKVPACRHTFNTLDGGTLDLGSAYSQLDYTMIVRWAEWCPYSKKLLPTAVRLAEQYEGNGLQTIWAYGGGEEAARKAYMAEVGLDKWDKHIIECTSRTVFQLGVDHAVWDTGIGYSTPFVEIVNKEGNIVFVDDPYNCFSSHSFAHKRADLEYFLSNLLGGNAYQSSDYSADGTVHTLQAASEGSGINLVLMGDAFSDRLIADGTYAAVMNNAAEAFFSEEPYKSFRNLFNVKYVDVVSENEIYNGETAFSTWYGEGTKVGGDHDRVYEYACKAFTEEQLDDAVIIVMMNRDYYAGTCYMSGLYDGDYGRGCSIAYFPTSSNESVFNGLVSHEAGGHGFAKLADEYSYSGTLPEDELNDQYLAMTPYGWWKNVDFTSDPTLVKWSQFIADDRYAAEGIGVYEGACTYAHGAWRPTVNSIMNDNTGGFNAPSRYAIWYRIGKLAYGKDWNGTYEDFVTDDAVSRTPAAIQRRKAMSNSVEKPLPPLAPPVIIDHPRRTAR